MVYLLRAKRMIAALALSSLITLGSSAEAAGIQGDKFLHFGCSAIIEAALSEIPPFKKWTPLERALFNVAVFGVGKELYDRSHGGKFDWGDMAADALGAGAAEIGLRYVGNRW